MQQLANAHKEYSKNDARVVRYLAIVQEQRAHAGTFNDQAYCYKCGGAMERKHQGSNTGWICPVDETEYNRANMPKIYLSDEQITHLEKINIAAYN